MTKAPPLAVLAALCLASTGCAQPGQADPCKNGTKQHNHRATIFLEHLAHPRRDERSGEIVTLPGKCAAWDHLPVARAQRVPVMLIPPLTGSWLEKKLDKAVEPWWICSTTRCAAAAAAASAAPVAATAPSIPTPPPPHLTHIPRACVVLVCGMQRVGPMVAAKPVDFELGHLPGLR